MESEKLILSDAIEQYIKAERIIAKQKVIIRVLTVLCIAFAFIIVRGG